jgi:hypothetical protein
MLGMNAYTARKEPRIRSRGVVHLLIGDSIAIEGTVYDVSPGGISVETSIDVPLGAAVNIDAGNYRSAGVVRHCRSEGSVFRVGVDLEGCP